MDRIQIFVSYSHDNNDWVANGGEYNFIPWLQKQLVRHHVVFWIDNELREKHVGEKYRKKIKENIDNSDIALLLISQEFASSEFITTCELPWIKEAYDAKKIKIIPLLLTRVSPLDKPNIAWVDDVQFIPDNVKPLLDYTGDKIQWSNTKQAILETIGNKIIAIRNKEGSEPPLSSADKEHGVAEFNKGLDCDKSGNHSEAVEWYRKAAAQGHAAAQYNLGVCYSEGWGVEEDKSEAVEWHRKAADQGHAAAQYFFGCCYFSGEGVEEDKSKAIEWYRKAADQGLAEAQYALGSCYEYGDGVKQNIDLAIKWYRDAAKQGREDSIEALKCLGVSL